MTRVKICGLTLLEDALRAAEWGADALGFVFAPGSRRRADPERVSRIVDELPPFVTTVGVFQDQPLAEVRAILSKCRLDLAQLHGAEGPDYAEALGCRILKALRMTEEGDLRALDRYPGMRAVLLDAAAGGSGTSFDWLWAKRAAQRLRVVLAGGLHPGNVVEAIETVRPWAVDTASGTEKAPGVKDPERLRLFLERVRTVDCRGQGEHGCARNPDPRG